MGSIPEIFFRRNFGQNNSKTCHGSLIIIRLPGAMNDNDNDNDNALMMGTPGCRVQGSIGDAFAVSARQLFPKPKVIELIDFFHKNGLFIFSQQQLHSSCHSTRVVQDPRHAFWSKRTVSQCPFGAAAGRFLRPSRSSLAH